MQRHVKACITDRLGRDSKDHTGEMIEVLQIVKSRPVLQRPRPSQTEYLLYDY